MAEYELQRTLTAKDIRAQVNLIQEVMKAVMKKDTHYGTIPGCDKPTLYKAGSEILLTTFKISIDPVVEELSTMDETRYRVLTRGYYRDGTLIGTGVGECSSNEEKYKWRKSVCDEEFNATPEDRRREKWFKGKYDPQTRTVGESYKVKQVRTEIADVANTVLKMAKKRSQIDLTLTATAASDIFTQDIEDMPEGYAEEIGKERNGKPPIEEPKPKNGKSTLSENQIKRFYAISLKSEATPEMISIILDAVAPNKKGEDGKFDWVRATKPEYDKICTMFEDGSWKTYYSELMAGGQ
jgi:hypothetical protein